MAGERASISINGGSPVLPQDPGCMSPPRRLGDAGPSARLPMLWPDQGADLAGEKPSFGLHWFPAGARVLVSSRMCLSCAPTGAAAPTGSAPLSTAACWLGGLTEASDQITLRIMASERAVI